MAKKIKASIIIWSSNHMVSNTRRRPIDYIIVYVKLISYNAPKFYFIINNLRRFKNRGGGGGGWLGKPGDFNSPGFTYENNILLLNIIVMKDNKANVSNYHGIWNNDSFLNSVPYFMYLKISSIIRFPTLSVKEDIDSRICVSKSEYLGKKKQVYKLNSKWLQCIRSQL